MMVRAAYWVFGAAAFAGRWFPATAVTFGAAP